MIASNTKALTTLLLARLVGRREADVGHARHERAAVASSSATRTTTRAGARSGT